MLEQNDLYKIGEIVEQKVKAEFEVAEKRITETVVKEVVESVSELTDNLEKHLTEKIDTLADKESVNRMMDQSLERDQKLDKKINTMAGFLAQKKALEAAEVSQLQAIKVFGTPRAQS